MYVADFRSITNLHAVRVMNGATVPTNGPSATQAQGFTLATINPLYVWGNYIVQTLRIRGSPNVSAAYPAALVSDAITVLSSNWVDSARYRFIEFPPGG